MSLLAIKNYMRIRHTASFFELKKQFNLQPELLRDMLEMLVRKGSVRRSLKTDRCGSKCNKCDLAVIEVYEWVDSF